MTDSLVIALPLLIGFGLLYWSSQLDEENILILIFQGLFIPLSWLSIHFAVMFASINYALNPEIIELLANLSYYLGWLMFIFGIVYIFKIGQVIYQTVNGSVSNKQGEKYD